jgi:hypothetical protein
MENPLHEAIRAERLRNPSRPQVLQVFETERERMSQALAYRLAKIAPDDDAAIPYVGMSFREMAETLLSARGDRWAGPEDLIGRAILSGDLPALLSGAGNRVVRAAYESFPSLLRFCGRVRARDFRDVKLIQLDGDLALKPIEDGAPVTEGVLKAAAETFPIGSFGRSFVLGRTLFMQDDLQAFANLGSQLGRFAAEFAAGKVVAALESTAVLADGAAPFSSGHNNVGTAGALSETTIGEMLKVMRLQAGLGGERISAVPKAFVVPPALEFLARKTVWALGPQAPFEVWVEPRLTSATAFYLLADPATVPAISYAAPDGYEAPQIAIGPGESGNIGLRGKVVLDFGCGWSDFRGAAKNLGA